MSKGGKHVTDTCVRIVAVMWGRHDKRTKKGKRHIGKLVDGEPAVNFRTWLEPHVGTVAQALTKPSWGRYLREGSAAQT